MTIWASPELPGRIVHAESNYQMNEAGEERVGFTEAEWAEMLSDPAFGYVCRLGHRIDQAYAANIGGCRSCDMRAEMIEVEYYEQRNEEDSCGM